MSSTHLSHSPGLRIAASSVATIFVGFGINAFLRPQHALSFFELVPTTPIDTALLDSLMVVYAARDVFMGAAIYAAAAFGDRRALGWIMVAAGAVAGVDGVVSIPGGGEWNHWGYAPMLVALGGVLLGALDRR